MVQFILDLVSLFLETVGMLILTVGMLILIIFIFYDIPNKMYEKTGMVGVCLWLSFVSSVATVLVIGMMS